MAKKENFRSVFFLAPALPLPGTEQWQKQVLLGPQLLPRVLNRGLKLLLCMDQYLYMVLKGDLTRVISIIQECRESNPGRQLHRRALYII
jgi:hypothetical protein